MDKGGCILIDALNVDAVGSIGIISVMERCIGMKELVNYIRSCFCKHEMKVIEDRTEWVGLGPKRYLTYKCSKCGFTQKYDSWC
jgi:hypothetical protein